MIGWGGGDGGTEGAFKKKYAEKMDLYKFGVCEGLGCVIPILSARSDF